MSRAAVITPFLLTRTPVADRRPSDNNLAAVIELLAEASMHEAMLQAHETIKVTINIDEIIDDEKGVPIPPANMTEAGRRPSVLCFRAE